MNVRKQVVESLVFGLEQEVKKMQRDIRDKKYELKRQAEALKSLKQRRNESFRFLYELRSLVRGGK